MKSSTLAILATLAFAVPGVAFAQSTTVGGTVGATVDANGVSVNAGANGSANTNTNGPTANGTTDAAAAGGNTSAVGAGDSMKCEELGTAASIESIGKVDTSALSSATKVTVVPVADCDSTTRSALAAAGGTNISDALKANAAIDAAIMAQGSTMGDIVGATVDGDTVTVYVESKTTTN